MASAANNEAFGNPAWRGGPQGQAWSNRPDPSAGNRGWGPSFWGGPGWQNQGPNLGDQHQGGWMPHPFWYPVGISKPMAILFAVLGFIFWWPVGLAILFYMLFTGRMGYRGRRRRWQAGGGQGNDWQDGGGWTSPWKAWCSGGPGGGSSSGNHAFDEYRTETLRRLEDEQKEFTAFLDRLRFAKDKAEFDQFMAERRQQPPAAPPPPQEPDHA